jgi:hypothetical protein
MKKYLMMMSMFVSFSSAAGDLSSTAVNSAGFDKLTTSQQAAIIKQVTDTANRPGVDSYADEAEKWVNIGSHLGKGLAATAKELGVAVNDFVQTPVGQVASALIIWKLIGREMMHVLGSGIILFFGFTGLAIMMNAHRVRKEWEKSEGGKMVLKSISKSELSDEDIWFFSLASLVVLGASLITLFTL